MGMMSNMQTTLPKNDFIDTLIKFDMMSETGEAPGFVFVGGDISDPHEFIALEYAKKYGANAVYFRRFDGRPPIPQIYIYDFTCIACKTCLGIYSNNDMKTKAAFKRAENQYKDPQSPYGKMSNSKPLSKNN